MLIVGDLVAQFYKFKCEQYGATVDSPTEVSACTETIYLKAKEYWLFSEANQQILKKISADELNWN